MRSAIVSVLMPVSPSDTAISKTPSRAM